MSAADNPDDTISNSPTNNQPQRFPAPKQGTHRFADDLYSEESASAEIPQPRSLAFANVHVKILGRFSFWLCANTHFSSCFKSV